MLSARSGGRGPTRTPPGSTCSSSRTSPGGPTGQAPGPRLPLHLLLPPARAAAALAPGVRRGAGGRGRSTPASRDTSGAGTARVDGRDVVRRLPAAAARRSCTGCWPRPPGGRRSSGASGCTSGRWSTASPRRAAPATTGRCGWVRRHRRGGRVAPDRVLPLRRVPLLHRPRAAAQRAAARPRRPGGVRAAGLPARRDGPLQARVPAHADGRQRPGRRLLRAGARHPRPRHARRAVRPRRPRLRPGADRDAGGQGGVRRGAARVRRAGRSAAAGG